MNPFSAPAAPAPAFGNQCPFINPTTAPATPAPVFGIGTPLPATGQVFGNPPNDPTHSNGTPFRANGTAFGNPPNDHAPTNGPRHMSGSNTAYFHVGSPGTQWSPLNPQVQNSNNANFGNWAPGAGTERKPFDAKEWSVESKKVTKELKAFDGDMATYDNWRRRIRDHFVSVNCNYAKVFELIERQKTPIDWNTLATTRVAELPYLNWQWVATHLWSFTGAYLTDIQLTDRATLSGGQEFNGLEHWRALFLQNCGGSSEMANAERGFWIAFPKCEKSTELHKHLSQWVALKMKYGGHLPEPHLIHMMHEILPDDVKEAVKLQRDMKESLQKQIDFIFSEISTFTESKLSKWNLAKLQQSLKPKNKNTTGISAVGATAQEEIPPPPTPDMQTFQTNLERIAERAINAAVSRGRPSDRQRTPNGSRSGSTGSNRAGRRLPNPKFEGCWCCGAKDHNRQSCPKFAEIKRKNGGKVPKDYIGEYEKSLKSKATPVKAINVVAAPIDAEFEETRPLWPLMTLPDPPETRNRFNVFEDSDDSDSDIDESEVAAALAQISSHVTKGKTSQRKKKSNRKSQFDMAHLNAIAQQVKNGVINLPDLEFNDNADYDHVWALVDSGAGANVARRDHFKSSEPVDAPPISLTVANGDALPNKGARRVVCTNPDGTQRSRTFYEADVDMPILSVGEISQEGTKGSEVRFRKKNGYIEDVMTGEKMPFIKRKGVYFIKLRIPKNGSVESRPSSGFPRPVR